MGNVTCQISMSLDGYVAGPNQSLEHPLGEGRERLHEWAFATASWRKPVGKAVGIPAATHIRYRVADKGHSQQGA